jgi:lysophospholipase L1-like esterase
MSARQPPRDDSLIGRFDRTGRRTYRARDAVFTVLLAAALLVVLSGQAVRRAGDQMNPGVGRSLVLAVGRPTSWVAGQLPLAGAARTVTSFLSPDRNLSSGSGFASHPLASGGIPPVTPDAFDPGAIGAPAARRSLHTLLVTGDSMSMPLDDDLAQRLAPRGVHVIRDPHIGTGISNSFIVDWGKLSAFQVRQYHPDAVVVFIGANDGYPMPGPDGRQVSCCGAAWASVYANRARQMAYTYRQAGAARLYWLTLPTPREAARQTIARVVNAAIEVAVQPWASQVRVINTVPIFTPGGVYRDAMTLGGTPTLVRQADGIHLNDAGSSLLAGVVLGALARDFTY